MHSNHSIQLTSVLLAAASVARRSPRTPPPRLLLLRPSAAMGGQRRLAAASRSQLARLVLRRGKALAPPPCRPPHRPSGGGHPRTAVAATQAPPTAPMRAKFTAPAAAMAASAAPGSGRSGATPWTACRLSQRARACCTWAAVLSAPSTRRALPNERSSRFWFAHLVLDALAHYFTPRLRASGQARGACLSTNTSLRVVEFMSVTMPRAAPGRPQ